MLVVLNEQMLKRSDLTPGAKLLYGVLQQMKGERPSNIDLAKAIGVSVGSIYKYRKELTQQGLLASPSSRAAVSTVEDVIVVEIVKDSDPLTKQAWDIVKQSNVTPHWPKQEIVDWVRDELESGTHESVLVEVVSNCAVPNRKYLSSGLRLLKQNDPRYAAASAIAEFLKDT